MAVGLDRFFGFDILQKKTLAERFVEVQEAIDGIAGEGGVTSVNGETGAVVLEAADVGALPDTYEPPAPTWASVTGKPTTFPPVVGTGAADAAAGNHTHTFAALAGTVSGATGSTLQEILEDLATRLTALEPDAG